MDEDRAAAPGNARPGVVVELDYDVVETVGAAQPVAWFIGRPPEGVIVAAIGGLLAPGIVRFDPA